MREEERGWMNGWIDNTNSNSKGYFELVLTVLVGSNRTFNIEVENTTVEMPKDNRG
jgi:hypothetical protein